MPQRSAFSIIIVLILLALAAVTIFVFFSVNGSGKKDGFVSPADAAAADILNQRTGAVAYLLTPFFTQDNMPNFTSARSSGLLSWVPTMSEIANVILDDNVTYPAEMIDSFSCIDTRTAIDPSILARPDANLVSAQSDDVCEVVIGDCIYSLCKRAIKVMSVINSDRIHFDCSDAVATRAIMLLRPCAIRVGTSGDLLKVRPTTMYDSSVHQRKPGSYVNLSIVPKIPNGIEATYVDPVRKTRVIVCYYLTYIRPHFAVPATVPRQVVTIMYNVPHAMTNDVRITSNKMSGIDLVVPKGSTKRNATVTLRVGSSTQTHTLSIWSSSLIVVTWSCDILHLACISKDECFLKRMNALRCSYLVPSTVAISIDDPPVNAPNVISKLTRFGAIPNLSDIASRLYPPRMQVERSTLLLANIMRR